MKILELYYLNVRIIMKQIYHRTWIILKAGKLNPNHEKRVLNQLGTTRANVFSLFFYFSFNFKRWIPGNTKLWHTLYIWSILGLEIHQCKKVTPIELPVVWDWKKSPKNFRSHAFLAKWPYTNTTRNKIMVSLIITDFVSTESATRLLGYMSSCFFNDQKT